MFASGIKKNVDIKPSSKTAIQQQRQNRPLRFVSTVNSGANHNVATGGHGDNVNGSIITRKFTSNSSSTTPPQAKSKYTESKPILNMGRNQQSIKNMNNNGSSTHETVMHKPTTASDDNNNKTSNTNNNNNTNTNTNERKRPLPAAITTTTTIRVERKPRIWNRRKDIPNKIIADPSKIQELKTEDTAKILNEIAVQTNELEILNRDLLIGDIKFLMPSQTLVDQIERSRKESQKKILLKQQRKFEEHAERQEEHLTDLKEFLERGTVTRRRKTRATVDVDKKLMSSMDEILNKSVPRTESIVDIKGRILKKEQELMSLFDNVENLQNCSK